MSLLYTTSNSRPNVGYNLTNELLCLVFALQQIRKEITRRKCPQNEKKNIMYLIKTSTTIQRQNEV